MNLKTRITAYGRLLSRLWTKPPTVRDIFGFIASGSRGLPRRDETRCTGCGACNERCSSGATSSTDEGTSRTISIDSLRCIFCGRCADVCPEGALDLTAGPVFSERNGQQQSSDLSHPGNADWLSLTDNDLDITVADRFAAQISLSHEIHERDDTVDTTLTLQTCPVCGEVMPVTETFLRVIAERVLENLQPDTALVVRKDMERYLTACISCRRKMSIEWNTHPRKFI
ncbi:MAG: 4Fe-4S binding protein [Methanospirillum sp.]|uniref:4Fe-4S dicluster domain-containing protein n=1 Tax=Methanospirillum sp. TaxID=45200 RepID=UPI0023712098|nr:4Fe-4S binding protein [Methanospirillum sp.]MDD1729988.1 4Fe-4S binding protein [Methanospirillum sp.]